ncbi:MAG: copper transporter [Armatimonadetes bacterium]|nr:copper transporter [Armatimonadota bacterium]
MLVDYRYHIGSFVAIFFALLLGILIGIGLAPSPDEFADQVAMLKEEYRQTQEEKAEELQALDQENREYDMLARETVAAVIKDRLAKQKVAIVLDRDFGHDPLPDNLRATLKQAGATVTSTTTVTKAFVTLPQPVRSQVAERLSLYPPPGVHFRTLIAQAIAKDLALGRSKLLLDLHASGLLVSSADADYTMAPDAVLILGGAASSEDSSPERIDLPLIQELKQRNIRVVGAESRGASVSVIPTYKAAGVPTVDNADTPAGRLAIVLTLAGADGHYGVKDTADSYLPPIPSPGS